MSWLHEAIQDLRGASMRGLVQAVHDTGEVQTVDVITHDGMLRSAIEVFQFYGFATCAPAVGSVVQLVAIGGDPGDLVALPPICPAARFGGLLPDEVVIYDAGGQRVALRQGGVVQIMAQATLQITAPAVVITGNVTLDGTLTATGDVIAGGKSLETHVHPDAQGGDTGPPV